LGRGRRGGAERRGGRGQPSRELFSDVEGNKSQRQTQGKKAWKKKEKEKKSEKRRIWKQTNKKIGLKGKKDRRQC